MATLDERVARLEGIIEEIRGRMNSIESRMNSIENRLNVQIQLTVAMWVTTMVAVLATLAAVLLRG
jgi:tetrahydromethanopterin S-methyltransferase subunit B